MYKSPKNDDKYIWTNHVVEKMRYYRLSESLVKRVVRFPKRIEQAIAPNTIGAMISKGTKEKPREVWVMYRPAPEIELAFGNAGTAARRAAETKGWKTSAAMSALGRQKLKIISAWIYPGVTKPGDPIPVPEAETETENWE